MASEKAALTSHVHSNNTHTHSDKDKVQKMVSVGNTQQFSYENVRRKQILFFFQFHQAKS